MQSGNLFVKIIGVCAAAIGGFGLCNCAIATGVLYADPAWYHAFEGNSAYYHDPDGPNPDYTRSSGPDDNNQPGGQSNQPALINPGPCANPTACAAIAIWQNQANQWEGSAPGAPLGGPPGSPPVPPPAPGGVGAYTQGSTTYIRIQDPGQPQNWGWADKGEQGFATGPRQEGNNRKIEFKHEMNRDAAFSDRNDILDFGVTISFRTRIATTATGPLDALYPEGGGTSPTSWPTDGVGYPVGANRGIFMITQTGVDGPGQLSFGLLDNNTISTLSNSGQVNKTGLVMNNQSNGSPGSPVDTSSATTGTLNVAQINNNLLTDWHEFWITASRLTSPINGNTHEVKVYMDGSLTPEVFNVVLASQNEFGTGSHLGLGLTSGTRFGAVDVDFFAYKEGVFPPTLPGLPGDFNSDGKVDAGDYATWRKNNGTNNALANDNGLGTPIGPAHYNLWRQNFGNGGAGSGSTLASTVPEPSTAILFVLSAIVGGVRCRRVSNS